MSDIVTLLRGHAWTLAMLRTEGGSATYMKQAADEIDRLRAERDALGWARVELANIVHAKRFNKLHFSDDTEFADWAQSRARHQLVAIDAAMAEEARTRQS